jgi:hypothetical protein
LTKKQPEDTKLLILPSELVDRLKEVSMKRGTSLSGYAMEVLEEGLRAEKLGAGLDAAVEAYRMREIHMGAGGVIVSRGSLRQIIESLGECHSENLEKLWDEAGRWYGKYILGKLGVDEVFPFLRQDLLTSWNLDECEIKDGDDAVIRFTGFMMSEDFTRLLLSYIHGLMESLGFHEVERDSMRGMATIKYLRLQKGNF